MEKLPFLDRLQQEQPLLADGAMGTLLHHNGAEIDACFEALNLNNPDLVVDTHWNYIKAGARLIETNTFGANRYSLAEYGMGDQVAAVIRAAVKNVRRAIAASGRDDIYIVGAVGPLAARMRPYGRIKREEVHEAFVEQFTVFAECGVDAILLETFSDHAEILEALTAAREAAPDMPVICQMTFAQDNRTLLGHEPAQVAHELHAAGADVIGVNCSGGPNQIALVLEAMHKAVPDALFSAMPNAGFPQAVGGRVMYPATADYFGDYALTFRGIGANIIGGCCGTTPAHITAMSEALNDPTRSAKFVQVMENHHEADDAPQYPPTSLMQRLTDGKFTVTVEIAPPRSFSVENLIQSARLLREAGAHLLDVADTPAARMRMSPWAVCHLVQSQVGMETVLHFPTRGRNLLRVQGDLLAAHAMNLRNLFVTMGDPTKIGDYPDAMDQYDIVPSKLIGLIKHKMNAGQDMAENSIGQPTAFTVGCALNMFADDLDRELQVLNNKLQAGADFALGQSVFEPHKIERFLKRYEEVNGKAFDLPVLMGILPLYSLRHAQFLHNEVPGITIPDHIMKRLEDAGDDAPAEGVQIAQGLLRDIQGLVAGAYIIPAFGKYHLAAEVIDAVAVPV